MTSRAPTARPAKLPDVRLTAAELESLGRELRSRLHARVKEREECDSTPRIGWTDAQILELEDKKKLLDGRIKGDRQELRECELELRRAKTHEAGEAAARDAASIEADLAVAMLAAERAEAALQSATRHLQRLVSRLFDPEVRRRLETDPTAGAGLRARVLRFVPDHRLAELEREGRSLVESGPRWPRLIIDVNGGARFEDLEVFIKSAADLRAWLAQGQMQSIPATSEAARQLGDLMSRLGR